MKFHLVILFYLVSTGSVFAIDSMKVHADFFYIEKKNVYLDIYVQSEKSEIISLDFKSMFSSLNQKENQILVSFTKSPLTITKGINKITLNLTKYKTNSLSESFFQFAAKYGVLPVGEYNLNLSIQTKQDTFSYNFLRLNKGDIKPNTELYKIISKAEFKAKRRSKYREITHLSFKTLFDKEISKYGVSEQFSEINGSQSIDIYSSNYALGTYQLPPVDNKMDLQDKKEQTSKLIDSKISNGLDNYESVFSQFKNNKYKEKQEGVGYIGLSTNLGNQQEAFSNEQNNFYEIDGNLEVPIFDIPVTISGFYTTQDIGRKIKSSYIHFQYDASKAKEKMMKLIANYKGEYEVVESKGKGLEGTYQTFLSTIESQKVALGKQLLSHTGLKEYSNTITENPSIPGGISIDTTMLMKLITNKVDSMYSSGQDQHQIDKTKDSLQNIYNTLTKKYNDFINLQKKYDKYHTLLDQYKNTNYFDSLLSYEKMKDIKNLENLSYKDLAKSASSLLPEGNVKKVTTGITSMNVGVFSKYNSKYTLGGQQLKGIDIGYDFGVVEATVTTGKTEYIGRTGEIDRYTFYTGSLRSKPIYKQQFEMIYYGYSPSQRMFNENKEFFNQINTTMPSFQNPGHILALKHQGTILKRFHAESEIGYSYKSTKNEHSQILNHDNLAYSMSLEGDIPKSNITFISAYEHIGKYFENNTLPFAAKGTDRIKLGIRGGLFQNKVEAGIEYNSLIQHNISGLNRNARWGFDIKYKSKILPTFSLSYKPFSTFRSFTDTMLIPQRPLFGEVWTGKANYQYKKGNQVFRCLLLYNKSTSSMDTNKFNNEMVQLSFHFINKLNMTNVSISRLNFTSSILAEVPAWHAQNRYIIAVGENYTWNKSIQTNGGVDLGVSQYGVSSIGGNLGITYRASKRPLTYRMNGRYMHYKLEEGNAWQNVIRGSIELIWRFRFTISDNEKY